MRFFGLCLILIAVGLATACAGSTPGATTSTLPTDQTVKCTVFATREGLVGRTTANGHVIQPTDRFVALPSKLVLARAGGSEFQVRITYKDTTVTVPVWDVGPWNTEDNYWDPSEQRLRWKDLPQCRPQAQAAYEAKYNDGKDQSGRQVKNPAGIDLSDGTWAALGMTDNDKVVVEYLWTKGSAATGTGASAPTQRLARSAPITKSTTDIDLWALIQGGSNEAEKQLRARAAAPITKSPNDIDLWALIQAGSKEAEKQLMARAAAGDKETVASAVPRAPATAAKQNPSATPTPSRKGQAVVMFAAEDCRNKDNFGNCVKNIYTAREDGTGISKVAEAGRDPFWSPDGTKIAFVSTASGDWGPYTW